MSAPAVNFTLQDIIGATQAFCLFPLVIVFPGYVIGWALELFNFRQRQPIVRLGIGLVLSFAVSPIILDLTSSLFSLKFSLLIISGFATAFAVIILKEKHTTRSSKKFHCKTVFWFVSVWAAFVILSLIQIQWKDQLFLSMVSDQNTRTSIISAMTRTGVPPINPSYYPGHPIQLTFLYYFWYILGSMIDIIGGRSVDARAALNASSVWAGLGLMATIALYIRLRNPNNGETAWRSAKIGIGLLAISGLDVLPFAFLMAKIGNIVGNVEHLNPLQFALETWKNLEFNILTLLGQWVGSILWVPHHIAALIAGMSAVMLMQSASGEKMLKKFTILTIAGLGFASALGLSVWVTFVFVVFWVIWLAILSLQKRDRDLTLPMVFAGLVAMLFASPFIVGIFQGTGGETGQFPIAFEIRAASLVEPFVKEWTSISRSLLMLALLPVGYLLEIGFFFMAGIYWLRIRDKETIRSNPFYLAEFLLLAVALVIGSCLRSTLILNNDLGWRGWLPGQFVLLVWGIDIIEVFFLNNTNVTSASIKHNEAIKISRFLRVLITVGILTTIINAVFLRIYQPVLAGTAIGQRYYSARFAYDYLRDYLSIDVITQNNPTNFSDGPSGLYGTHQMVISDITAYGVPLDDFHKLVNEVGVLFTNENMTSWQLTDDICQEHLIDVLIIKDSDPLWSSLATLKAQRPALYENTKYALFACGDYAHTKH